MKKIALLIDGEWFRRTLQNNLAVAITADVIYRNAMGVAQADEEVFRLFFYDSIPHEGREKNPISKKVIDYSVSSGNIARKRFFKEMGQKELVALRRGYVRPRGWSLTKGYVKAAMKSSTPIHPPKDSDIGMSFEQKGVDMRIGIDVATLSIRKQVERIILFSGDCDMIPAMKLARRQGVQVAVVQVVGRRLAPELVEDSDIVRTLTPVP
jgi:uncharacterized LabA/DUF88 family protein